MTVYWVCTTQYAVSYCPILNTVYIVAFIKPVLWIQQRLAASLFIESVIEIICHVMHCAVMLFIGWRCSAHPQCPAVPRERGQTHPWPWALRADRTDPRAAAEITVSVNTQQSLCGFKQRGGFYYTSDPWRPSQRDPTQSNTHTLNLCVCVCVCVCARSQQLFNQCVSFQLTFI